MLVREASGPQRLEDLLKLHPIRQLHLSELVLFVSQLSRVTYAATTTVRGWAQTQALLDRLLSGLDGRLEELTTYEQVGALRVP